MRILFLTDNYPPEFNAPAARTAYHCRVWAELGAEVTVVTCAPNFPAGRVFEGYRNRLHSVEEIEGVRVVRVWTYITANAGFLRRTLDYISFGVAGTVAALAERADVIVATSPQFFTAVAGGVSGALKRTPWVFELRDFWPESIVATGAMRRGAAIRALEWLEMRLYRSADAIVPVTEAFRRQLVERGVAPDKIHVVTNGVDVADFDRALEGAADAGPADAGPTDGRPVETSPTGAPFTVGYLGTHGLAHGLDLVLRTAPRFDPGAVRFVLVGDGAEKAALQARAAELGLANVEFRDPVPREAIPATLAGFDAALVPLRDTETFRSVLPSKLFEAGAAARPVLLGVRGEAQRLMERHDAGLSFAPEREDELAAAIERLRGDAALRHRLAQGGRALARAHDRRALAERMFEVLRDTAARS